MATALFTQIEVENLGHVTLHFAPKKCVFPKGIVENQEVTVNVVGEYSDENCKCLIVTINGNERQASGTYYHITTALEKGTSPVETGKRATALEYTAYPEDKQYTLTGVATTFIAK